MGNILGVLNVSVPITIDVFLHECDVYVYHVIYSKYHPIF